MRRARPFQVLATVLACACLFSGCVIPVRPELGALEERLNVYLKTEAADKAFLTLDAAAASVGDFAAAGTTTGPTATAARITGDTFPSFSVSTRNPLPNRYYLNLSKPVVGTLFWTSTSASAGHDYALLRLEFYQDATRVGGQEFLFGVDEVAPLPAWVPYNFLFRPEVRYLEAGKTLTLKITRLSGYADLTIGAMGDHASNIEFRYYEADPLGSAIYVRDNHIVSSLEGGGDAEFPERAEAAAAMQPATGPAVTFLPPSPRRALPDDVAPLSLPIAGFLLLPWTRRGRPRAAAGALLVATLAASGCFASNDAKSTDAASIGPTGKVDSFLENRTGLAEQNAGALEGSVADENGFPVVRASVSLVGTFHFTHTGTSGLFAFPNLTAGDYDVRFDAVGFVGIETTVGVEVGKVRHMDVILPHDPARAPHGHDYWGGATKKVFDPITFLPRSYDGFSFLFFKSATALDPVDTWYCPGANPCETVVPLDPAARILPGTVEVEVRLSWEAKIGPRELQLGIQNPANDTEYFFSPRGPDDPFRVAIFPNEADPGHQNFTSWVLTVRPPYVGSSLPDEGTPAYSGGPVTVSITIHKGVVPYERPHRKMWNGATQLPLFTNERLTSGCANCPYPDSSRFAWRPANQVFVPPGTATIKGTFKWKNWNDNTLITWGLTYQGADAPPGADVYHPIPLTPVGPGEASFEFSPPPDTVDKFYQYESLWRFAPDDQQDPIMIYNGETSPYLQEWWLTAVAYRAPDYVEEPPA